MVQQRLAALRRVLAEKKIAAVIVPTADPHQSEYVGDYFKARAWLSGFTGSAGVLIVTPDEAGLWTDGRYFIQAEKQLAGSGITLYRMGVEGVPTEEEFLLAKLKEGDTLAFDGKVLSGREGSKLAQKLAQQGVSVLDSEDLVGLIWQDRPAMSCTPAFLLEERYAGRSAAQKLESVRKVMAERGADTHLLTTLDDIAWLFNIRADDVACTPVLLSYALVTMDRAYLYVNPCAISEQVKAGLEAAGVELRPYEAVYAEDFSGKRVLLDSGKVNFSLCRMLEKAESLVDEPNPEQLMKAVKNPVEIDNLRRSHIKDGVAFTKFMYWLKNSVGRSETPITERSAAAYLEDRRREQEGFIEPSFSTISAYRANAAMMHYSATPESDAELRPEGLYLVDSGGQYYEGTTDITRTIVLGPLTHEQKKHFTLVLVSMLRLAASRFLYGCRGLTLDYAAREPLWNYGLDFNHGTGHGVGYLLNVHERPNRICFRVKDSLKENAVLEEGMVTSDEPGLYIEGSHGIRTENLILCRKDEKNAFGQFMRFEYLTWVPIDLEGIDTQFMTERDRQLLNEYHRQVYEKISPCLPPEEQKWLKDATAAV